VLSTGGLLTGGRVVVVVVAAGVVVGGDVVDVGGMVVVTGAWVVVDRDVVEVGAMVVVVVLDEETLDVGVSCVDVTASGSELRPQAAATTRSTSAIRRSRISLPPFLQSSAPATGRSRGQWHFPATAETGLTEQQTTDPQSPIANRT
jgi:hypothetical protein